MYKHNYFSLKKKEKYIISMQENKIHSAFESTKNQNLGQCCNYFVMHSLHASQTWYRQQDLYFSIDQSTITTNTINTSGLHYMALTNANIMLTQAYLFTKNSNCKKLIIWLNFNRIDIEKNEWIYRNMYTYIVLQDTLYT